MTVSGQRIEVPPLRGYEIPDVPAVALPLPVEKDTFVIPGERMTSAEIREMAHPVRLPPLHLTEEPDVAAHVIRAEPDRYLDEPDWGVAKRMPEISVPRSKYLRPWDD